MTEVCKGIQRYSVAVNGNDQFCINGKETHFKVKEFACKDGSDELYVDCELIEKLEVMRLYFDAPITINSAYRTKAHNAKVKGSPKSQHLFGRAADIVVKGITPAQVAEFAKKIGFRGVGQYGNFVHVDTRETISYWKS